MTLLEIFLKFKYRKNMEVLIKTSFKMEKQSTYTSSRQMIKVYIPSLKKYAVFLNMKYVLWNT